MPSPILTLISDETTLEDFDSVVDPVASDDTLKMNDTLNLAKTAPPQARQNAPQPLVTTPHGQTVPSSRPLELEQDRNAAFRRAKFNTYWVRFLRFVLPVAALGAATAYVFAAVKTTGWGNALAQLPVPTITPENITMENPRYSGFTKDGGAFNVTAKTAQQDFDNTDFVKLEGIRGELVDAKQSKTLLVATRGTFNTKTNLLIMKDGIDIKSQDGMQAQLETATVQTKSGIITSKRPVQVSMAAGQINADTLAVDQKKKAVTFQQNVVARLTPKTANENAQSPRNAATKTATPPLISGSSSPIDIAAARLDVDDINAKAVFSGDVKAVQDNATLITKQLDIDYENNSANGQQSATAPGQAAKVKRITARYPILMTQGASRQVTSQSADFDAINETALLIGNVVMVDGTDRRAVADQAEIQARADSVVLVGNVIVTQGTNELRGHRLFVDRPAGLTELTADKRNGRSGRITALFAGQGQSSSKNSPATKKSGSGSNPGNIFAFQTSPDAPVKVDADKLTVRDKKKNAVFTGNVRASQGNFVIRTVKLTAVYKGSAQLGDPAANTKGQKTKTRTELTHVKAEQKVVITSANGQKATGDWANFDLVKNKAVLGGDVILSQGKNVIRGSRLSINMTTGRSQMETGENSVAGGWGATLRDGAGKKSDVKLPDTVPIRGHRPSAVFYPGQFTGGGKKSQKGRASGAVSPNKPKDGQASSSSWAPVTDQR